MKEIETINKNKKQRSYQAITTFQKIPVSNFIALNQAKEQGTNILSRHRNALVFEARNEVKEPETKLLLSHGNQPF